MRDQALLFIEQWLKHSFHFAHDQGWYQLFGGKAWEQYDPKHKSTDWDIRVLVSKNSLHWINSLIGELRARLPANYQIDIWKSDRSEATRVCLYRLSPGDNVRVACLLDLHPMKKRRKSTQLQGLQVAPLASLCRDARRMQRDRSVQYHEIGQEMTRLALQGEMNPQFMELHEKRQKLLHRLDKIDDRLKFAAGFQQNSLLKKS